MSIRCVASESFSYTDASSSILSSDYQQTAKGDVKNLLERGVSPPLSPHLGGRISQDGSIRLKHEIGTAPLPLRPPPHALRPISSFSLAHQHTIPAFSEPLTPPESPIKSTFSMPADIISTEAFLDSNDLHQSSELNPTAILERLKKNSTQQERERSSSRHGLPISGKQEPAERDFGMNSPNSAGSHVSRSCSPHKRGKTMSDLGDIFSGGHSSAPVKLGVSPSSIQESSSSPPTYVKGFTSRPSKLQKRTPVSSKSTIASWLGFGSSPSQEDSARDFSRCQSPISQQRDARKASEKVSISSSCKNFQELTLSSDDDPLLKFDAVGELQRFAISSGTLRYDPDQDPVLTHSTALLDSFCIAYKTKHASLLTILQAHDEIQEDFDALTSSYDSTFEELIESKERVRLLRNQLGDLGMRIEELESRLGEQEKERGRWMEYQRGHECLFDGTRDGSPYTNSTRPYSSSSSATVASTQSTDRENIVRKLSTGSSASSAPSLNNFRSRSPLSHSTPSTEDVPKVMVGKVVASNKERQPTRLSMIEGAPFLPPNEVAGADCLLRDENVQLKIRIKQLEDTLEGCLGLVA